jgi:hypothetical protein
VKRFFLLGSDERVAYLLVLSWLIFLRALLPVMSFRRISSFIVHRRVRQRGADLSLQRLAAIIGNAGRLVPSTCLTRSLAGAVLLARFGYRGEVMVGVSHSDGFQAHAWLAVDGAPITDVDQASSGWSELTRITTGA